MVDKGDSDAKMAHGDLIDFKSDVTYTPKTENLKSKVSTGKKSKASKSFYDKSDSEPYFEIFHKPHAINIEHLPQF